MAQRFSARTAALGALAAVIVFSAILLVLHLAKPDIDPTQRLISQYELGAGGGWMVGAFIVLGIGVVGLAIALRGTLQTPWSGILAGLLILSGVGFVGAGVFIVDSSIEGTPATERGMAHNVGGYTGLFSLLAVILLFPFALRHAPAWREHKTYAWTFAAAGVLAFLAVPAVGGLLGIGVGTRIFVAMELVWIASIATSLTKKLRASATP